MPQRPLKTPGPHHVISQVNLVNNVIHPTPRHRSFIANVDRQRMNVGEKPTAWSKSAGNRSQLTNEHMLSLSNIQKI